MARPRLPDNRRLVARKVTLRPPVDDWLCRASLRTGVSVASIARLAIESFLVSVPTKPSLSPSAPRIVK